MNKHTQKILASVTELAKKNEITESELLAAYHEGKPRVEKNVSPLDTGYKFNAADALYYLGATVITAAIMVFLGQAWDTMGAAGHVFGTFGIGVLFWTVAAYLLTDKNRSEQADGIGGALLFVGALMVAGGIGVTFFEFLPDEDLPPEVATFAFLIIASLHFGMDMIVKRTVTFVGAVLAAIGAYGSFVYWIFENTINSQDFWGIVSIIAGGIAIGAGSALYKAEPHRDNVRTLLWALGGFTIIASLFGLTLDSDLKIIWQLIFPAVLYGTFVLSIKNHSKNFLYTGTVFLFAYVMNMSFQYFGGGLGTAGALVISGFAIIGSGVLAQNLRKKYF